MVSSAALVTRARAEIELRRRVSAIYALPDDIFQRVGLLFDSYIWYDFSKPHTNLWQWVANGANQPFIALWPRGRGKSTHAEMVAAYMGIVNKKNYCLYVSETQPQADKHVATIQSMLESSSVSKYNPAISTPKTGTHGSRQWRRSIMTTSTGYTVEAIGLNKAIRGQKIDWARPDLIIFDDIDAVHDTEDATKKKINTITKSILPAGSVGTAVLFVQNLIHPNSIAVKLSKKPGDEGAADWLANRVISGAFKAVEDLQYESSADDNGVLKWRIVAGRSLWNGFDLSVCEDEITLSGPTSFETESQHEVDTDNPNALLNTAIIDAGRVSSPPDLYSVGVGVDPSGGAGQCGIVGGGIARINDVIHGYTLVDRSTPTGTSSLDWALEVLKVYHSISADFIIVERNFGGDMAANNIRQAVLKDAEGNIILSGENVNITEVSASRGKEVRAQPVATLFELGRWHHVGHFPQLQKQWTKWIPGTKPSPDRLDAEVWLASYFGLSGGWVAW